MDLKIFWCSNCLNMSTRPRIIFDDNGRCNACVWTEEKKKINWEERKKELLELIENNRSKNGTFDCIVPVSGGKDGSYVSYNVKHVYGLRPLTVTLRPPLSFELGDRNLMNFINSGYDHIHITPNVEAMAKINRMGFIDYGRPLYGWTAGIFSTVLQLAQNYGISLIFYGEDGEVEYGGTKETEKEAIFDQSYIRKIYLEGHFNETLHKALPEKERSFWQFQDGRDKISITHWSYFESWDPYRNYLVAKEKCGLEEKQEANTGTYTNFAQNDTFLYDLHTYLMYLKFGFGRATQDAGIDIRRGALSRTQAIHLVKAYDNQLPEEYIPSYLKYYNITRTEFDEVIDKHANKNLFFKNKGKWHPKFEIQ